MEIFPGEGIGPPEKAISPDKTAGPWLPSKNKSTGRANVGESPWEEYVRRVNDAKRRKHHAVDQQEDIPHGALVNGVAL